MTAILLAALVAPAAAFPLTLQGEACVTGTAQCTPILATLQADGTGNFTAIILVQPVGGQLQWASDPATGRVGFLLGGVAPLVGQLRGSCAVGTGTIPTPPPLRPLLGVPTLPVNFELCRVP
jgi:hypothetical protein